MGTKRGQGKRSICVVCAVEFPSRGRKKTCSDVCKQTYWPIGSRREPPPPRSGDRPAERHRAEDILINGKFLNRLRLHRALQELGRPYVCEGCGLGPEWQGRSLTLDIDHINGEHNDNRPDNLRYLCPNCHRQCDETNRPWRKTRQRRLTT